VQCGSTAQYKIGYEEQIKREELKINSGNKGFIDFDPVLYHEIFGYQPIYLAKAGYLFETNSEMDTKIIVNVNGLKIKNEHYRLKNRNNVMHDENMTFVCFENISIDRLTFE